MQQKTDIDKFLGVIFISKQLLFQGAKHRILFYFSLFQNIFITAHTRNAQPCDILCGYRNSAVRRFLSLVDPVHQICLHKFTSKLYTRVEKYISKVCICPEILSEDYRNTLFSFQYS